jgi:hypothetical protein
MKANDILNKIKNIVGVEFSEKTKLAEMKLENGTLLVSESFESGKSVFIKTDDEQLALPVGEYTLEDGRILMVKEEGLIDNIIEAKKEEVKEEAKEEKLAEDDEAAVYDWAGMEKRIKNLEDAVADLKADKQPRGEEEVEASKEEIKEETKEEVKEELSAEVSEPIKHNPEAEEVKQFDLKISANKQQTTMDRVYSKIFNNKI